MKFTYKKVEPSIITGYPLRDTTSHHYVLENTTFQIIANAEGVEICGQFHHFQPEDGECHMPVEDMREFMNRLASAFEMAWKEKERYTRNLAARQAILGLR